MFVAASDIGGRPYMEDTFIASSRFIHGMDVCGVFDGHGGDFVANYMRDRYEDILKEILKENTGSIPDMLYQSFKRVVEDIPKDASMTCGSTALVALRYGEVIFIANAGDCRAVMNNGQEAVGITVDHKPNLKREFDRIHEGGGHVTFHPMDAPRVNGNLAVSRSIGDFYLHPHVTWVPDVYITKKDPNNNILVLASDGLWDVMKNDEVIGVFVNKFNENNSMITRAVVAEGCNECILEARRRGSSDNITILVYIMS